VATISTKGIGVRFLIAFLLVVLTWNPTPYNYVEWAISQWSAVMPLIVFVGLVLVTAWVFFCRATARSLGMLGIGVSLALSATVFWILFSYGLVSTASTTLISWLVLALLALILAIGMSWSHLSQSWSGQVDVDDTDER